VVGETGSGKSTIAKLLCRLADPERGEIRIGGVPLAEVDPAQRRHHIRLVPQDGFLFDTTVAENVMAGTPEVTLADVDAAVDDLGLRSWVDRLPEGLATPTGERGEALSLGERQLVALLRAQISDPSLLVLDEATSSVDPETERALSEAFVALAKGRTTITIAHRLSTAENSDLVVVVAHGEVVAIGTHTELLETSPDYATMFAAWVGATAVDPAGLT
jgi:ABC-type multidrug transport system fused ATPase/permease subunit